MVIMAVQQARGFSRMELLVVGFCVTLFVSLLLPSLTTARSASRYTICIANLRTLGAAALLYARDYEDKIPGWGIEFEEMGQIDGGTWTDPTTASLAHAFEWGYIWEYVQSRSAFVCPTLKNEMNPKPRCGIYHSTEVWGWPGTGGTNNPPGPMWSYSLNGQAAYSMNDPQWRVNPELVLPSPTSVMMLYEQDYMDYASFDNSISLFNPTYSFHDNSEDSIGRYHKVSGEIKYMQGGIMDCRRGSGNICYFDGHVGEMSLEEYIEQRSTAQGTLELCGGNVNFIWPGF